jgi:hypothetical protein
MEHPVAKAEAKSRTRAYILLTLALVITVNTIIQLTETTVSIGSLNIAWFILVLLTALNLTALPFSLCAKSIGTIMNDELTQHFRLKSLAAGFWMSIAAALAVFIVSNFVPVSGVDVAHVIVGSALVAALVRFSTLELLAGR